MRLERPPYLGEVRLQRKPELESRDDQLAADTDYQEVEVILESRRYSPDTKHDGPLAINDPEINGPELGVHRPHYTFRRRSAALSKSVIPRPLLHDLLIHHHQQART